MKPLMQSLKEVFRPVAMALGAFAVAAPLLVASPASAAVMNQGPVPVVMNQLNRDGYQPVGAGVIGAERGRTVLLSFFKNADDDWIALRGNDRTWEVVARGTDLEVKKWNFTVSVADNGQAAPLVPVQSASSQCSDFNDVVENILRSDFSGGDLLTGRNEDGSTMQAYIRDGNWVMFRLGNSVENNTCLQNSGAGFRLAEPPTIAMVR